MMRPGFPVGEGLSRLRNLLKANEAREAQAQAQAQAQVLEKERPKSPEPLALASPAPVSPAPAPAEDFKVWLTQQVRGITEGERPGEELQGRELLGAMSLLEGRRGSSPGCRRT